MIVHSGSGFSLELIVGDFFRTILRLLCFINEIQCRVRCNLSSSPWYQGGLVSAMCPVGKSSRFLAALVFFKSSFLLKIT